MVRLIMLSLVLLMIYSQVSVSKTSYLYVSKVTGHDYNDGSLKNPLASIKKSKEVVRSLLTASRPGDKIIILILGGIYYLNEPLKFSFEDSGGNNDVSIEYKAFRNEKVILSGGIELPKKWVKVSRNNDIWRLDLKDVPDSIYNLAEQPIRQLFLNEKPLSRSSSSRLFCIGPIDKYFEAVKTYRFDLAAKLRESSLEAFCTFKFQDNDLLDLDDEENAEILVYHSWEASWHKIFKVDKVAKSVYLTNPFRYPSGFFGGRETYKIENSRKYLKPGTWYYSLKEKSLYYFAQPGEIPNSGSFIVPKLENLISFVGDPHPVKNISLTNIQFSHTKDRWGINTGDNFSKSYGKLYDGLNMKVGYSSSQGAPDCGQAVYLFGTSNIRLQGCSFRNIGAYAINISSYSHNNTIESCTVVGAGGGGIIIGTKNNPLYDSNPKMSSPSKNKIVKNLIQNIGTLHPSSIGILILHASSTEVRSNSLKNLPYSAISVGWSFGFEKNMNYKNVVSRNKIYNAMQELADGGGIYTLGRLEGSVFSKNKILKVNRSVYAIGGDNSSMFFDEGSSAFKVVDNVFESTTLPIRYNKADSSTIILLNNKTIKYKSF